MIMPTLELGGMLLLVSVSASSDSVESLSLSREVSEVEEDEERLVSEEDDGESELSESPETSRG
jgi:hypothetical protein